MRIKSPTKTVYCLLSLLILLAINVSPALAQDGGRDARFGAIEAFWDPAAASEANVAWERILFYWSQLQPYGPDDWNTLHVPDQWLQDAQAQGREVVGLLKNTPAWASDGGSGEATPPQGLDLPIDDPGNLWAAFVRRAASFYGERGVHHWIIWNEPDIAPGVYGHEWGGTVEQYYRLLKVAYQVIKGVDPGATVHLAGITHWHDPSWLGSFLAVAAADPEGAANGYFFDVASLHIYFQTDSVDYIVNTVRATMSRYGINKPIWINETNASPDSDPDWPLVRPRFKVDLREQASFIMQSFALGLAAGAQRIAVYKLIDAGLPPGGEPFGLLRPDHSRRPAYTAYQLVTRYYAGTGWAEVTRHTGWTQVTLHQGERTTRVFWARLQEPVSLTVPALAGQALLVDQTGAEQVLDGSAGSYQLELLGARCADPADGCIIGGSTVMLVEAAASGSAPVAEEATTTAPTSAPSPTAEGTLAVTPDLEPTAEVTELPTEAPTLTPTPTETATPSATPTATRTPRPSATPTTRVVVAPSVTPSTTPSPTRTAEPTDLDGGEVAMNAPTTWPTLPAASAGGQDDGRVNQVVVVLAAVSAAVGLAGLGLLLWSRRRR